jgi:hypothetical protein
MTHTFGIHDKVGLFVATVTRKHDNKMKKYITETIFMSRYNSSNFIYILTQSSYLSLVVFSVSHFRLLYCGPLICF